jgi:8-oxo-dGTP diphosphatase
MQPEEIHFCPRCGSPVTCAVRFGRERPVCPQCEWIYFADPKVASAGLIFQETGTPGAEVDGRKVLLVQRANEPWRGFWTLPAGFVDAGEDPAKAVVRECWEETGLRVKVMVLLDLLAGQEHARGAHILLVYRCEVVSGELKPGDDALGAGFFSLDDLPPLGFESTKLILSRFSS